MACTKDCVKPSPAQAHCGVCHRTFGGVGNFDRHRKGGTCTAPESIGLTPGRRGVWVEASDTRWWDQLERDGGAGK